ncbi:hypothetical protein MUP00_02365 [Candidatus Bathyarchaeota archaeon]|nr:hypothetical protein [Candidatus Bathyarchaeota archaeon]
MSFVKKLKQKTGDAAKKTVDVGKAVGEKGVDVGKKVGEKAVDVGKDAAEAGKARATADKLKKAVKK